VAKNLLEVDVSDINEMIMLSRFLWQYVNAKTIADADNPNVIMGYPLKAGQKQALVAKSCIIS
jgi:5-methylcytosine-specific restriction protein B